MSTTTQQSPVSQFRKYQPVAAGMALIGLAVLAFSFFSDASHRNFYASFMFAWTFWGGLTLGAVTLTFLHHTIRAQWSLSILRVIESANQLILPMGAIFLVVTGIGITSHQLYQWSDPNVVQHSELLQRKTWFLNAPGYFAWSLIFMAYWAFSVMRLNASSRKQDETKDENLAQARTNFAAPGGVLHVLALTFAVTYWIMSLDPAWSSTIYGVWFMIQEMRCCIALGVIVVVGLRMYRPYSQIVTSNLCRDLGWMLEGLTMFWAYVSLAQFLIIWSGNLPEEITFYNNRFEGFLDILGGIIIVGQWLIPFLLLLSFNIKRKPEQLVPVAWWIFIFSAIDIWWQVTPFFRVGMKAEYIPAYLIDLGAFVGIGGLWLFFFLRNLINFGSQNALIATHDTRLIEEKIALESHHAH